MGPLQPQRLHRHMAACASRTALTIQVRARCISTDALVALESKSVPSPVRPQKQRSPRVFRRMASARARAVTRVSLTRGRSRMPSSLPASLADCFFSDRGTRLFFFDLRPHRQYSLNYALLVSQTPSSDQTSTWRFGCLVACYRYNGLKHESSHTAHVLY